MWWLLATILILLMIYYFLFRPFRYWKNMGVVQKQPVPIFGNFFRPFFRYTSFAELSRDIYNFDPGKRYIGMYQFSLPTLLIRDPDLLKEITVKNFDNFLDHRSFTPENADPLWSKNLFSLKGQRWKDMRSTLGPTFTSSKMKGMFQFMSECAENFVDYFLDKNEEIVTVELKDSFSRYTNDVIASSAFGVKCDSLKERNNEFFTMGCELNFNRLLPNLIIWLYVLLPSFIERFKFTLFPKKVSTFFRSIVKETIDYRERNKTVRPDLLNILMEASTRGLKYDEVPGINEGFATVEESDIGKKTKSKILLTDEDITAQALLFFFGGFETSSTFMCFLGYELAVNPNIQKKLHQEIDQLNSDGNKITYESLLQLKYFDMVVSETLRKWPVGIITDRLVTKPYVIEPKLPGEKPVHLKKGDNIWIPTYAFHRDENNFPEPERFDPERFNHENLKNIKPYTYIPFGNGPRNCIGSRFALLETKTVFFHLLTKFEIVPVAKSQIPLVLSKEAFNLMAADGFWFGLKRRK